MYLLKIYLNLIDKYFKNSVFNIIFLVKLNRYYKNCESQLKFENYILWTG